MINTYSLGYIKKNAIIYNKLNVIPIGVHLYIRTFNIYTLNSKKIKLKKWHCMVAAISPYLLKNYNIYIGIILMSIFLMPRCFFSPNIYFLYL